MKSQHNKVYQLLCSLFYKLLVVHIYFRAYIHLRFKHAILGTPFSCLGCLSSELIGFVSLLIVNEREEGVVALYLLIGP